MEKVSGEAEEELAKEYLFIPLGIHNYQWEKHSDGATFGAFGLWLIPRNMAKIGKLMVQKGMWNSEHKVSQEWIAESTQIAIIPSFIWIFMVSLGRTKSLLCRESR